MLRIRRTENGEVVFTGGLGYKTFERSVLRLPLGWRQTAPERSKGTARTLADAHREHILEILNQANWLIGKSVGFAANDADLQDAKAWNSGSAPDSAVGG
jgi:hypothetical protein